MSTLQWWAYRHINGTIQVKRYFDARDLEDARESDFVKLYTLPFDADSREDAIKIAEDLLDE